MSAITVMRVYREIGQAAYETFSRLLRPHGPSWAMLPEQEKQAWREIAMDVIREGWTEK